MPVADVGVDGPDRADGFRERGTADEAERAAYESGRGAGRVVGTVDAVERVGIGPQELSRLRFVAAKQVVVVAGDHEAIVGRRQGAGHGRELFHRVEVVFRRPAGGEAGYLETVCLARLPVHAVEGEIGVHVHRPQVVAAHLQQGREHLDLVGLGRLVAVFVGPEHGLLADRVLPDHAPVRVAGVSESFPDADLDTPRLECAGKVESPVAAGAVPGGSERDLADRDAEELRPAGLWIDPELAAFPDHQVRVDRVDGGAAGAVVGGAEKLRDELARSGVPHAEPFGRGIHLRRPHALLRVYGEAVDDAHAGRVPRAEPDASSLLAELAKQDAFRAVDEDLVVGVAVGDIDVAFVVGRESPVVPLVAQEYPRLPRERIEGQEPVPFGEKVREVVPHDRDLAGGGDVDRPEQSAGGDVDDGDEIAAGLHEIVRERFFEVAPVYAGPFIDRALDLPGGKARAVELGAQGADHGLARVGYLVVGRAKRFLFGAPVLEPVVDDVPGPLVELQPDRVRRGTALAQVLQETPPAPDMMGVNGPDGEAEIEFPVPRVHAFRVAAQRARHTERSIGIAQHGMDRDLAGPRAGPGDKLAVFGRHAPEETAARVEHETAVGRDQLRTVEMETRRPDDVVAGSHRDQGLAGFRAAPAEIHVRAVGRAGNRLAVIASPVRGRPGIPGIARPVVGPSAQPDPDPRVSDGVPCILAGRHGCSRRAGRAGDGHRESVPFQRVLALRPVLAGERLPYDNPVLVPHDHGDKAVVGHGVADGDGVGGWHADGECQDDPNDGCSPRHHFTVSHER